MRQLTYEEETAWLCRVHAMQLAALEMKRAASAEERVYREYIAQKYGAVPKAIA